MLYPLSWKCWSRRARTGGSGASAGCVLHRGYRRARPGRAGRRQLRRARRQRPGLRAARHRENTRTLRRGPPAGGIGQVSALRPCLPPGAEPAPAEAGDLLAAKRDLSLQRQLHKMDNYDFLLLDDLGYLPQGAEESEVLFTLIATNVRPWASRPTWSSPNGSTSSPTPWPPRQP